MPLPRHRKGHDEHGKSWRTGLTQKVLFERSSQIIYCLCTYFAPLRLGGLEFFNAQEAPTQSTAPTNKSN